jgi:DNA-binding response OmpR family regulator
VIEDGRATVSATAQSHNSHPSMPKDQSPAELLTAGLIHEIRHPLMGIKLGLQLIQRAVGEQIAGQAEWPMVLSQVARLEDLLRSYQRFLSPELAGPGVFELGPVMAQAIDLCMIRLKSLGDRFTYVPPPGGVYAHGTPDALTHALTNVIFNALDAVNEKGQTGRIQVRAMPSATNDGRIEVRVSDEGSGIGAKVTERIFEPRFSTKPRDKGSGLGLSIARRMMEAAGGEVTVVERDDVFRLPWATTEFRIALWARVPAAAEKNPADAKRSVLLVEDDTVICTMLTRGLELSGYAVTATGSAEEAMLLIGAKHYDAVVTDKNLPGKSGEEVARTARAKSREIALVMMTGYSSRESAREMHALRADAYLTKPFEIGDLTQVLAQAIGRRKGQATVLARIKLNPPPLPIYRIAVVEPDAKDCLRLEKLIRDQGMNPLLREDVLTALDESPPLDALVVNSGSLTDAIKQRLLDLEIARPEFRVILISPAENMSETITAILLNAAVQLIQPWTDAHAAEELRRGLDPREVLR